MEIRSLNEFNNYVIELNNIIKDIKSGNKTYEDLLNNFDKFFYIMYERVKHGYIFDKYTIKDIYEVLVKNGYLIDAENLINISEKYYINNKNKLLRHYIKKEKYEYCVPLKDNPDLSKSKKFEDNDEIIIKLFDIFDKVYKNLNNLINNKTYEKY